MSWGVCADRSVVVLEKLKAQTRISFDPSQGLATFRGVLGILPRSESDMVEATEGRKTEVISVLRQYDTAMGQIIETALSRTNMTHTLLLCVVC